MEGGGGCCLPIASDEPSSSAASPDSEAQAGDGMTMTGGRPIDAARALEPGFVNRWWRWRT